MVFPEFERTLQEHKHHLQMSDKLELLTLNNN